ncbi:MAG: ImmA/IrrE family metallo-endopeptidase [Pseudomonadota bacterium]
MGATKENELDELELLQAVIERWEREQYGDATPTPLEAVRFRMDQLGLRPRDLEPFIGSRARVSEVLSGNRSLSIEMIRALHQHLGIPASALIAASEDNADEDLPPPSKPALKKLVELGAMKSGEAYENFRARIGAKIAEPAMLRKTRTARTNTKTDLAALDAWCAVVLMKAERCKVSKKPRRLTQASLRDLAMLSALPEGPKLAQKQLAEHGIALVTLPHLPGTYLDGAAMRRADGVPVIALTLRHDRVDNFWFTLLHECVHVWRHLNEKTLIVDDLDMRGEDAVEREADEGASDALIPAGLWSQHRHAIRTPRDIELVAAQASVHPAIVAGRWQRENQDYRRFAKMLGRGEVRRLFRDG